MRQLSLHIWKNVQQFLPLDTLAIYDATDTAANGNVRLEVVRRVVSGSPPMIEASRRIRAALPWMLQLSRCPSDTSGAKSMLNDNLRICVEGGQGGLTLSLCLLAGLKTPVVHNALLTLGRKSKRWLGRALTGVCLEAFKRRSPPKLAWLEALLAAGAEIDADNWSMPTPLEVLARNPSQIKDLLPSIHLLTSNGAWARAQFVLEAMRRVQKDSTTDTVETQATGEWRDVWKNIARTTLSHRPEGSKLLHWEHEGDVHALLYSINRGSSFVCVDYCGYPDVQINDAGWNHHFNFLEQSGQLRS